MTVGQFLTVVPPFALFRFEAVGDRPVLREALHKCELSAFRQYHQELEDICSIYETHKAHPPLARGRPPMAGAVEWSRCLQKRVKSPMAVFKNNTAIMKSQVRTSSFVG